MTDDSDLTLEQEARLLTGRDFWSTHGVEEAGIPSLVLTDGPHGVRLSTAQADEVSLSDSTAATCYPTAAAVGCSWDPDVARAIGAAIGIEARALGVHVVLGPGVNIKRSPLNGRNFEYYAEDPLLTGVLGAAHVEGLQSLRVGATVKHFAVNNQETERMRISAEVDERTLREIYLPAFERIVTTARPSSVMCSYNAINGVFASENRWLLTELLREEWGYDGLVMSDWSAVRDRRRALEAGLDLEMPGLGPQSARSLVAAVADGTLERAVVSRSAERVRRLADLTTGFPDASEGSAGFDTAAHHALARRLAGRCAVLLKNDGAVLPLARDHHVAVCGELARSARYQGGGSSHINPTHLDVPLDEIGRLASRLVDATALGADEAARVASTVEVAVVVAGLAEEDESEGFDRTELRLPEEQVELIRAVAAAAPRTVVVLTHGGLVTLEEWHDDVDAILDCFLLGQAAGGAIADLLFGVANPSGRLAETVPQRLEDNPSFANFPGEQGHVRYGEGMLVGYRWYEALDRPVRYPFGHGLSYADFEVGAFAVEATGPDSATVSLTVTNTGPLAGEHVVQVYVATQAGPVARPTRELRAFTKVALEPGESRAVELALDSRAFAYYDVRARDWVVAPGDYRVELADDAASVTHHVDLTLAGEEVVLPITPDTSVAEWLAHPEVAEEAAAYARAIPDEMLLLISSMPLRQASELFAFLGHGPVPGFTGAG